MRYSGSLLPEFSPYPPSNVAHPLAPFSPPLSPNSHHVYLFIQENCHAKRHYPTVCHVTLYIPNYPPMRPHPPHQRPPAGGGCGPLSSSPRRYPASPLTPHPSPLPPQMRQLVRERTPGGHRRRQRPPKSPPDRHATHRRYPPEPGVSSHLISSHLISSPHRTFPNPTPSHPVNSVTQSPRNLRPECRT